MATQLSALRYVRLVRKENPEAGLTSESAGAMRMGSS